MRKLIIALFLCILPAFAAEEIRVDWSHTEVRILAWDSEFDTNFFVLLVRAESAALIYESKESGWPTSLTLSEHEHARWIPVKREMVSGFLLSLAFLESGFGSQVTKYYLDVSVKRKESPDSEIRNFRACDMLLQDLKQVQSSPELRAKFVDRFGAEPQTMVRYQDIIKMIKEANKAMETTPVAVTPPAIAGAAPSTSVSHL